MSSVEAIVHPVSTPAVSPQPEATAPAADVDTPTAGAHVGGPSPAEAHSSVSLIGDKIEAKADDAVHVAAEVASAMHEAMAHKAAVQRQAYAVFAIARAAADRAEAEQAAAVTSANEVIANTNNQAGEAVAAAQAED